MNRKAQTIISIVIPCLLVIVILLSYFIKKADYEDVVADISYESFGGDTAVWQNGVLLGNKQAIFEGQEHTYLCYKNLETGITVPLCTLPDCEHNTNECMARFAPGLMAEFICCFDGKIYGCCSTETDILFYSMNMDGSDHELVTRINVTDDKYDEIRNLEFYEYDSYVYLALAVADTDDIKVLGNDYMSDAPSNIQIYCFELDTKQIEKLYAYKKDYYQACVEFRYIYDGVIYYDFSALDCPMEQIFDLGTGELLDPNVPDEGPSEVHAFRINTAEDTVLEGYVFKDYIGNYEDTYYFLDVNEDSFMSGDIRAVNYITGEEGRIHIKDLENIIYYEYDILVLENGFVVKKQDENTILDEPGSMLFYDEQGNKEFTVEGCTLFVNGEYQDMYSLGINFRNSYMTAYIPKKDIKEVNRKAVYLEDDE